MVRADGIKTFSKLQWPSNDLVYFIPGASGKDIWKELLIGQKVKGTNRESIFNHTIFNRAGANLI